MKIHLDRDWTGKPDPFSTVLLRSNTRIDAHTCYPLIGTDRRLVACPITRKKLILLHQVRQYVLM